MRRKGAGDGNWANRVFDWPSFVILVVTLKLK
jgi:hypothetical protein